MQIIFLDTVVERSFQWFVEFPYKSLFVYLFIYFKRKRERGGEDKIYQLWFRWWSLSPTFMGLVLQFQRVCYHGSPCHFEINVLIVVQMKWSFFSYRYYSCMVWTNLLNCSCNGFNRVVEKQATATFSQLFKFSYNKFHKISYIEICKRSTRYSHHVLCYC